MSNQEQSAPIATFYAIRNDKGEYYRTYAQGGQRSGWVKNLTEGRVWTTVGPARGKITALSNESPKNQVPELIEFVVREVNVVDQKMRVAESRVKKQLELQNRKKTTAELELQQALRAVVTAQTKVDSLIKELES
jgi:hypothetical protein